MTIVEWMAVIVAIAVVIKLLVLLVKPSAWMKIAIKPVYSLHPVLLMIVGLVLAGGSLYYLLDSGITIVQIFAVMFFIAMAAMMGIAVYAKEIFSLANKMLKTKQFLRKAWLAIIVWLVLAIWALKELFF